ncbi:GDP-mannose 4,6-dehydratase [Pseudomonas sp. PDM19]|uniref:NAD-dependent epimerase/dehydratase family protein n=1 Tax=Pseudomonas denitrificans TaxID=43306 RepID=A0A9X7N401_PSEDE|nr:MULTISPECIES: GDP-mannose 4,6-dehydratase [Pseudomonadaceae]MBD9634219.1 GDP-mannose 4,6-dehydratase [Pseudomonas sp. PDM19]QEY74626.1 NAD-dependent epimerase/dehydratase family protein [Pseudomonas denitrificans (nom. rej.)]
MNKTLLVTGLTGFVGQHLQAFVDRPDAAWTLLLPPAPYDLTRAETLRQWCEQPPDAVIHLAGQTFVPEAFRDPARTLEVNVLGTLNLLQALKAGGFSGRFLYVSSGDVYGQVAEADLPIHEGLLPEPRNPYAVSKLAAEHLCLQWGISEGWDVMVARPFNHIGAGQKDSFVMASAASQIVRIAAGLQPPQLAVGDVDVSRDFLDVRDVIGAYFALLESGKPGEVYNVCSAQEQSIRQLILTLAELANVQVELVQDPARMRRAEQRRVRASYSKLNTSTHWAPSITITQTLQSILSDWQSRGTQ